MASTELVKLEREKRKSVREQNAFTMATELLDTVEKSTVMVLSSPIVLYVGAYLITKWLAQPQFDKDGHLIRDGYISGTTMEHLCTNIDIAFLAGILAPAVTQVLSSTGQLLGAAAGTAAKRA